MGQDLTGTRLTTPVLLLITVTVGLCAGSNYFNQPLLDSIAAAFHVSGGLAAATVTVAQVSYAVGLVLIVPAGDVVTRRPLILVLLAVLTVGLLVSGFAVTFWQFLLGLILAGVSSVTAQVLVPFAAALAAPAERASKTGVVMGGLLIGILLARSVSGLLSESGGWQTVYRVAAVLVCAAAVAVRLMLPPEPAAPDHPRYLQALSTLLPLLRRYPRLATRTVLGGLAFAGASLVFATMALHLSAAPFHLNDLQIGLVGLVGVAGALAAGFVGRGVDRGLEVTMGAICLVVLLAAWACFDTLGRTSTVAFIVAMVLLDLGLQGVHVASQGIIQRLDDRARSRITSVYMTGYFIGAALGSGIAALLWELDGWPAVCAAGFALLVLAAGAWALDLRVARRVAARTA
ncbi:MFS transporter [Gryllotalpicola ginsengisoli]|uniref:MFS transporter n=1 Tax=Gryllotalpicola ginsengisoli TaxID=444608 RepID=UPI0003B4C4D7|nr:MFS transporter [Gryllotalpicola ginsengisoli]